MKKSCGFTYIGFLGMAALLFVVILVGFRVAPAYIEHYNVKDTLHSLQEKVNEDNNSNASTGLSKFGIYRTLDRMFEVNAVHSITAHDIHITPEKQGFQVQALYDVNVPLFGNISLTIHFDDSVVVQEHAS